MPSGSSNSARNNREKEDSKGVIKDVFLSHSGKQKNFVRQLYRDLTNQGLSCFFDEDRECLPVAEDFPSRIFEAAKTCKVAVLLLSEDFLGTKWPMLELAAFVESRDIHRTNPTLKILPLFFQISPDALKNITVNNERWKKLEKSRKKRAEWHQALNKIRRINGLKFSEGYNELMFIDEIVKEIWRILPTPSRYPVRCMQGQLRICQELADFFKSVHSDKKRISIAGLYGIAGQGKTTLCKAFCNFKLGDFEGNVCHLEFSRGDSLERIKRALQYLTRCPQSVLKKLTEQDQARAQLDRRVKGQRVLLVLDNITDESIDEVTYYLKVELGKYSWILLSARSVDVLEKRFKMDKQSCMGVPRLKQEEAIRILLERISVQEEPTLGPEDRRVAVQCAERCSFTEVGRRGRRFHPLALKAFGGHLFSKYGQHLSKWIGEIEGRVNRCGYGLDELLAELGKAFDNMRPEYRTIFMLLTVYMPPHMSAHKVTEWVAMILNKEISFVEKAVDDLCKMSFIDESGPEIRIHDLYIEFAQSKANEMVRWLWWKGDPRSTRWLISQDRAGFELAKLEWSTSRKLSQIAPRDLKNLLLLQLVGVQNMSTLDLGGMGRLRSITLQNCKDLTALQGMEKLQQLAWLQISEVNPMFKLPKLSSLQGLQHLEINIAICQVFKLGDLTSCVLLRDINVHCPSLMEFPRLNGLRYLEKVEFSVCDKVKGPLDCRECVELQSIVIESCSEMALSQLVVGCKELSESELWECDAVTRCDVKSCHGLKNLELWNMRNVKKLPSFRLLSNLTVLNLGNCGIREPPDLTSCVLLEDVYFFTLENLQRFPNFSPLRKLKKLSLYNCCSVQDPPDIRGCHKLQVFHLVYNDNMKGLPNIRECPRLEEIKMSWPSYKEIDVDSPDFQPYEDLQSRLVRFKHTSFWNLSDLSYVPEALKEWEWMKGKSIQGKRYVRGGKTYYYITAPYESHEQIQLSGKATEMAKKIELILDLQDESSKRKALELVEGVQGVDSVAIDMKKKKITVIGDVDPVYLASKFRKIGFAELLSVRSAKEEKKPQSDAKENKAQIPNIIDEYVPAIYYYRPAYVPANYYCVSNEFNEENPNACVIC